MIPVIITHEVKDFKEWKVGYDGHESARAAAGFKVDSLYQSVSNTNEVTIIGTFPGIDAVNGFVNSPGLKETMEKFGVISQPEIKVLNKVQ